MLKRKYEHIGTLLVPILLSGTQTRIELGISRSFD